MTILNINMAVGTQTYHKKKNLTGFTKKGLQTSVFTRPFKYQTRNTLISSQKFMLEFKFFECVHNLTPPIC